MNFLRSEGYYNNVDRYVVMVYECNPVVWQIVFYGCYTNRKTKQYDDIGLFKLPGRENEFYAGWKDKIVEVIKRYRVVDEKLRERIQKGIVWTCERHYKPEEIERTSMFFFLLLSFVKML